MIRGATVLLLASVLSTAPYQCSGDPDPANAVDETPGEALYGLAQEFRQAGNLEAWRRTLEFLIERYPSSRFAVMAKQELADPAEGHD
jgi:outer membrane protein assembly factor BamD (BamD/ComL family)